MEKKLLPEIPKKILEAYEKLKEDFEFYMENQHIFTFPSDEFIASWQDFSKAVSEYEETLREQNDQLERNAKATKLINDAHSEFVTEALEDQRRKKDFSTGKGNPTNSDRPIAEINFANV